MITTIDNNARVFQVVTSTGAQAFCNLQQLPGIVEELGCISGYYTICHFYNNKQKGASKKLILDMLKSAGIDPGQLIYYKR